NSTIHRPKSCGLGMRVWQSSETQIPGVLASDREMRCTLLRELPSASGSSSGQCGIPDRPDCTLKRKDARSDSGSCLCRPAAAPASPQLHSGACAALPAVQLLTSAYHLFADVPALALPSS